MQIGLFIHLRLDHICITIAHTNCLIQALIMKRCLPYLFVTHPLVVGKVMGSNLGSYRVIAKDDKICT